MLEIIQVLEKMENIWKKILLLTMVETTKVLLPIWISVILI